MVRRLLSAGISRATLFVCRKFHAAGVKQKEQKRSKISIGGAGKPTRALPQRLASMPVLSSLAFLGVAPPPPTCYSPTWLKPTSLGGVGVGRPTCRVRVGGRPRGAGAGRRFRRRRRGPGGVDRAAVYPAPAGGGRLLPGGRPDGLCAAARVPLGRGAAGAAVPGGACRPRLLRPLARGRRPDAGLWQSPRSVPPSCGCQG